MATITTPISARSERLTYDDLKKIPPDLNRCELIEGELFVSPAPNTEHQLKSGSLFGYFWTFVRQNELGKVLAAPYDVVLAPGVVLEPDIIFVSKARQSIIKEGCIEGAPDLVVEIVSDSSRTMDRFVKRDRYAEFGVPEYWLLDPFEPRIEVLRLEAGKYRLVASFGPKDSLESPSFPGFRLPLASL
jgi:Uma2 family endonuclease